MKQLLTGLLFLLFASTRKLIIALVLLGSACVGSSVQACPFFAEYINSLGNLEKEVDLSRPVKSFQQDPIQTKICS